MSKKVKNISGQRLAIPRVGVAQAGEIITVPDGFNNPNFEPVKSGESKESTTQKEAAPKQKEDKKNEAE